MTVLKPFSASFLAGLVSANVTVLVTAPLFDDPAQGLGSSLLWVGLSLVVGIVIFGLLFQKMTSKPVSARFWMTTIGLTVAASVIGIAMIAAGVLSPTQGGALAVLLAAICGYLMVRARA